MPETTVFVRKASGLVRAWSLFDGFIYAFFSVNLVTLGLYIFSFAPYIPQGHLVPAIVISTIFILFEIVVYSMLISVMPRAGGDYVWQSRLLGGGIGFVLCMVGWVFILWHWVPVYGTILAYQVLTPILLVLGSATGSSALIDAALWFTTDHGLFIASLLVIATATAVVSLGMKGYARVQKACFFVAMGGLLLGVIAMLVGTKAAFMQQFDAWVTSVIRVDPGAYQRILTQAAEMGYSPIPWNKLVVAGSLPLIPMVVFWNLWPNWGATLYGEVQGAGEFKRNFWSMTAGLLGASGIAIILLALFNKTFGWDFYLASAFAFYEGIEAMPVFPYPGLFIALLNKNIIWQLLILLSWSAWFFGWCGTVFLSSTRVAFAAAFDRVLPEWIAYVSPKTRAPVNALLVMSVGALVVSVLYSYLPGFATCTLDTTLAIALTYFGTTIAGILLPYKDPVLYNSSPVSRYKIFGLPWITVAGVIFGGFLIYNFVLWIKDDVYGINNPISAIYMGALYLLAIVIYYGSKVVRQRQGISLDVVYKSIPVE